MSKYIDASTVKVRYRGGFHDDYVVDYDSFMNAPSIDIVRCKECKYREACCRPCYKSADSYCSDGEREDEPQTCEECEHWSDTEDGCADRHGCKTENSSEKPNNCDTCRNKGFEGCEQPCLGCGCCDFYEPKDKPQTDCSWK